MRHIQTISFVIMALVLGSITQAENTQNISRDSIRAILDSNRALDSLIGAYQGAIDVDSINSYIEQLVEFKTRFLLADNHQDIAVWIGNKFRSFGYDDIHIDSFQNTIEWPLKSGKDHTTWQYNVSAMLTGSENPSDVYILGAHYDCLAMGPGIDPYTYSPGADNDASGVAACLEIARIFKQHNFVSKYSIEFVGFGSEEFMTMFVDGGSGAQNFTAGLKDSDRSVKLMIDNNQIAYTPDTAEWKLDFQNYPGAEYITDLAHVICEKYTSIMPVDTNDHIMYTDARYFYEAGIPAIFFEEFHFSPFTFTAGDISKNCNMNYCAEVAKISCGMLVYLNF